MQSPMKIKALSSPAKINISKNDKTANNKIHKKIFKNRLNLFMNINKPYS